MRRIGATVLALLVLAGCVETPQTAVTTASAPAPTATITQTGMAGLLNQQRAARGLGPLRENAQLSQAARRHAADMAQNGYFSHQGRNGSRFSDRAAAAGYSCTARAENIYAGTTNAAQVVSGWMGSDGHRRNILLGDVTEFGIGQSGGNWVLVLGRGC